MKQVPLVRVFNEDVNYRLQKILFDQVHDKGLIFGSNDCFIELDNPDVEESGFEAL